MMKKINAKRALAVALAGMMVLSLSAHGEQGGGSPMESVFTAAVSVETKTEVESVTESQDSGKNSEKVAGDVGHPEAVSQEDWEAVQKESTFGTTLNYLFDEGTCVSAVYLTEALSYHEDYGINAEYIEGESVVITADAREYLWGAGHAATILVLVINGVDITFVAEAYMDCKSVYAPNDSEIKTAENLKGETATIYDGTGNSDQSIIYCMLDEEGIDPTSEVKYFDIADGAASVAAMEGGETDASIFSDYFVITDYRDKMCRVCSITPSDKSEGEVHRVTTMNNDFLAKNPVHIKYIVVAIKRAGQLVRLHSEDAVQLTLNINKTVGELENQLEFRGSLDFGLSNIVIEEALGNITADYIRLGAIQKKEMTADDVMKLAQTNVCSNVEVPGLTAGDPKNVDGCIIEIQQKGE